MSPAPSPASSTTPCFSSLALDDVPRPDFADVALVPLPDGAPVDPAAWARAIFDVRAAPVWVRGAFVLRQALAPLIGVPPGESGVFDVARVEGEEALIVADDDHLDFRCGVAVDGSARLVRVTTAVRLHGWRGRAYFAPVQLAHGPIVQSMMRRAARSMARQGRQA
ncbi:hypothetical protein GCM10025865_07620 [Paraoerskovia sediminicola]|uniref:DUF2867 domain-containing protein n=1 Tax=Paraoerskovia sediminicola TaxID=1138587 RepID=A0ABM8G0E2_9CELL|nr:DUF2867 domain-containing protein [Paraoerskovia sediminicola]BDZ41463.1 hypothetical protein GCM10025865_07620 [Paraoerskovia sediminicola]